MSHELAPVINLFNCLLQARSQDSILGGGLVQFKGGLVQFKGGLTRNLRGPGTILEGPDSVFGGPRPPWTP